MQTTFDKHNVLLATDLSARCDRALDRAIQLATRRHAKLVVLYVYEPSLADHLTAPTWHRDPDAQLRLARRRLERDLDGRELNLDILVEMGNPVDCIRNTAESRDCEVIVTGMARDQTLGRILIGSTVERLLRESHVPILVVKNRPHRPYTNVLIASDFSAASAAAISVVRHILPDARLQLFHSYPSKDGHEKRALNASARSAASRAAACFLNETPGLNLPADTTVILEQGEPEVALNDYIERHDIDLAITSTHARTGLLRNALPSVAENLIKSLPIDVMVVRPPVSPR